MATADDDRVSILLAHLPHSTPTAGESIQALAAKLNEVLAHVAAAWSDLPLCEETFLAYLGERLSGTSPLAALSAVHGADLYLACACAEGIPDGLVAFDAHYLMQVPRFLASQRPSDDVIDEVRQRLRERLLVRSGDGPPRIAEYTGRGALLGWVRISAVRTALNLRRNRDDQLAHEEGEDPTRLAGAGSDPEIDYLRRRYAGEFRSAMQDALLALPSERRNLLSLHVQDGLSIDHLAPLFQASRASCARWLRESREAVLKETRRLLTERLHLSPSEFLSLGRLLRSQLELSLARCLRPDS